MRKVKEFKLWASLTVELITNRKNTLKKIAFLALLILVFGEFDYASQAYNRNSATFHIPTSVTFDTTVSSFEVHQDSTDTSFPTTSISSPLTNTLLPNAFGTFNLNPFTMAYSSEHGDQGRHEGVPVQFRDMQYVQPQNTSEGFVPHSGNLRMAGEQSYFGEESHFIGNSASTQSGGIGSNGAEIITNRISVPEPGTLLLLSTGLALVGILLLKRKLRR